MTYMSKVPPIQAAALMQAILKPIWVAKVKGEGESVVAVVLALMYDYSIDSFLKKASTKKLILVQKSK